jgi:hypothetical protein
MNGSLKLSGRVVNIDNDSQSVCIESGESKDRLRIYANNMVFGKLNRILHIAGFFGPEYEKGEKVTFEFYIQGRVLLHFEVTSRPLVILDHLYLETDYTLLDFVQWLKQAFNRPPKGGNA